MKLKGPVKVVISVLMVLYPVFVFLALVVFKLPMSVVSMGMLIMGVCGYLASSKDSSWWMPVVIGAVAVVLIITNSEIVLKFYPICITTVFLYLFGGSLIRKDPVVFHFALMMDSSIAQHPGKLEIENYCKKVTWVWTVWLIISISINVYLTFCASLKAWAVYNGPVCWIIQGSIFAVEFVIRHFVNKRINEKYKI